MRNFPSQSLNISTGIVLLKNKIGTHTYHIKVQSPAFSQMQYTTGTMIELYLSNPYYNTQTELRRYAFWEYEPIHHIADFAITISSDDDEKIWIESLQEGDFLFFKSLVDLFVLDLTGDHYFLIGDVNTLSVLYELNRALPISKTVTSLVYAEREDEIFADLDHSFPLNSYVDTSFDSAKILEYIQEHFPTNIRNIIVYIFNDSDSFIYEYFKNTSLFEIRNAYIISL